MNMKISIITVCYNSADTIEDTIRSVLSQDYRDIEYIVIDGDSKDGTIDILNKYRESIHKYISEPDKGIYDAMNKGIKLCTGDIVATLNSDDMYFNNNVVSRMADFINDGDLDAGYGDIVYIDQNDTSRITRYWKAGEYKEGAFCSGWVIPHPAFFCRKKVFEKYGYFNAQFRIAADFELMLRFIERHKIKIGYLPEVIVKMRTGGKANIVRGMITGNLEILKSFRLNGIGLSANFFLRKPLAKISQLFARHDKLKANHID